MRERITLGSGVRCVGPRPPEVVAGESPLSGHLPAVGLTGRPLRVVLPPRLPADASLQPQDR